MGRSRTVTWRVHPPASIRLWEKLNGIFERRLAPGVSLRRVDRIRLGGLQRLIDGTKLLLIDTGVVVATFVDRLLRRGHYRHARRSR